MTKPARALLQFGLTVLALATSRSDVLSAQGADARVCAAGPCLRTDLPHYDPAASEPNGRVTGTVLRRRSMGGPALGALIGGGVGVVAAVYGHSLCESNDGSDCTLRAGIGLLTCTAVGALLGWFLD